jgi:ActR/RegA family two-component response regulator
MEQKQPIGFLFDSVAYYTPNDINSLCDDMTLEQAYFMIIKSLEFAHVQKIFSMQETEIISKSLRILNGHFTETKE